MPGAAGTYAITRILPCASPTSTETETPLPHNPNDPAPLRAPVPTSEIGALRYRRFRGKMMNESRTASLGSSPISRRALAISVTTEVGSGSGCSSG